MEKELKLDEKMTTDDLNKTERLLMIENEDKKQDAQRNMAWFALSGMLLYPFAVLLAVWFGLDQAAKILGDMAGTYFVSVAAIVAAFYGKEAYVAKNSPYNVPRTNYLFGSKKIPQQEDREL